MRCRPIAPFSRAVPTYLTANGSKTQSEHSTRFEFSAPVMCSEQWQRRRLTSKAEKFKLFEVNNRALTIHAALRTNRSYVCFLHFFKVFCFKNKRPIFLCRKRWHHCPALATTGNNSSNNNSAVRRSDERKRIRQLRFFFTM